MAKTVRLLFCASKLETPRVRRLGRRLWLPPICCQLRTSCSPFLQASSPTRTRVAQGLLTSVGGKLLLWPLPLSPFLPAGTVLVWCQLRSKLLCLSSWQREYLDWCRASLWPSSPFDFGIDRCPVSSCPAFRVQWHQIAAFLWNLLKVSLVTFLRFKVNRY